MTPNDLIVLRLTRMEIIWMHASLTRILAEPPVDFIPDGLLIIRNMHHQLRRIADEYQMPLVSEK